MTVPTGYLPVEQGVACLTALRQHTDTTVAAGDSRTRDQIMADTLVERTGQTTATDVNVEVQIIIPLQALTDPDSSRTATVVGYGPLLGDLVRADPNEPRGVTTPTSVSPGLSYTSPHRIKVTAPTGHQYQSQAPDPP
jgi:hypothetical protein